MNRVIQKKPEMKAPAEGSLIVFLERVGRQETSINHRDHNFPLFPPVFCIIFASSV